MALPEQDRAWTTQDASGALLKRTAETYTAHSTASPAVQSNEVYLTPSTARAFADLRLGVR
jgi:hypothetical protein